MIHYSIAISRISIQAYRVAGYSIRSKPYVLLHYYCILVSTQVSQSLLSPTNNVLRPLSILFLQKWSTNFNLTSFKPSSSITIFAISNTFIVSPGPTLKVSNLQSPTLGNTNIIALMQSSI